MRAEIARGAILACLSAALLSCESGLQIELGRRGLATIPAAPPVSEEPSARLEPPPGLHATSGQLRSVPLTWDPLLSGDVGGYVIERSLDPGGRFSRLAVVPGRLATLHVDRDGDASGPLDDGVTAWYRLRSYTASGQLSTEVSPVVEATTAAPPAAPADLRAFSLQPRVVPLSWRASEDPTVGGYVLYRSPAERGPYEPIAEPEGREGTAYVDSGLGELRVFYYRVAARNLAGGEGPPSEPVRAVTKPEPLPPLSLRARSVGLGVNRLTWEPNIEKDVAEYRLLRQREGDDKASLVGVVGSAEIEAEDPAVGADERVVYTLVAVDRDGLDSAPSLPLVIESEGYDLSATVGPDGVHLAWKGRAGEGYRGARILRGGRFATRELGFVSGEQFVDADIEPGDRHHYIVVLERDDGSPAPASTALEIAIPGD